MAKSSIKTFIKEPIEIKGNLSKEEIVKKVINIFIKNESLKRGKGIKFRYPVEKLSNGKFLYIFRPGGLNKWNFDFKVEVSEEFDLGKGTHKDIMKDFLKKKQNNPKKFPELLKLVSQIYACEENDVDKLLKKYPNLQNAFSMGAKVDILLKIIKWLFIMEDIVYWNYQGRKMLYKLIKETENEK